MGVSPFRIPTLGFGLYYGQVKSKANCRIFGGYHGFKMTVFHGGVFLKELLIPCKPKVYKITVLVVLG
jgi:hypothetical protein